MSASGSLKRTLLKMQPREAAFLAFVANCSPFRGIIVDAQVLTVVRLLVRQNPDL